MGSLKSIMVLLLGCALETCLLEIKPHLLRDPSSAQPDTERQRGHTDPRHVTLAVPIKFHAALKQVIVDFQENLIAARQFVIIKAKATGRSRRGRDR